MSFGESDDVDSINKDILRQFLGEVQTFLSADTIKNNNGEGGQEVLMYPVKYLNVINCSSLPLHKLELKKGCQSVAHVGLDLQNSIFTHGQFYVAISRVTSVHRLRAIWDSRLSTATTKNIVYPEVIID